MTHTDLARTRDHLAAHGHSLKTISDYLGWLDRLQRWGGDLDVITAHDLLAFAEARVPLHRSARIQLRQAVRWHQDAHGLDPTWHVVRVPSEAAPICRALEPDQARTLFAAARAWDRGPEGLAVLLGQQQGLRRSEIAQLEWAGLNEDWTTLRLVGKGPKVATVPVHPTVAETLSWWSSDPPASYARPGQCTRPGQRWVFPGVGWRGHVTPTTVWTWVRRVGASIGLELTTHQLRHTFGAELNDSTSDLRLAQELMRHTKVTTTQTYTRVTWSRMIEGVMSVAYE